MKKSRTATKSTQQKQYIYALIVFGIVALIAYGINLLVKSYDLRSRAMSDVAREQTLTLLSHMHANRGREIAATVGVRRQTMLSLMENSPAEALKIALPESIRDQLPETLRSSIEEEVTLDGVIEALVADDFDRGTSKNFYFLKTDNSRYQLHFADDGPITEGGSTVRVKGIRLTDKIAVESSDEEHVQIIRRGTNVLGAKTENAVLGVTSTHKVAVILFNFSNNTTQPYTKDQARNRVFLNTYSTGKHYIEDSFNQLTITGKLRTDGDVFGWYTIPYTNSTCDQWSTWADAANAKAQAAGVDLTGYNNFIYVFPQTNACNWGGMGQVPGTRAWINGGSFIADAGYNIVGHEFGHNLGTSHATSLTCTNSSGSRVAISSSCSHSEYGDPFDLMASNNHHVSNFRKGRFQWFDTVNTRLITSNGTYTIAPIETRSTSPQALVIPVAKTITSNGITFQNFNYYLEFRRPYGVFDAFSSTAPVVNGISVRLAPASYTTIGKTFLIDTTPGTSSYSDAPLLAGRSFTDSAAGVTVSTNSITSTAATVTINFATPPCTQANPTVSISPLGQWGDPGQTLTYGLTVTNNNSTSCPTSTFSVTYALPSSGWTQTIAPISLASGATSTTELKITSPITTVEGMYSFTETVKDTSSTTTTGTTVSANYNVLAPPPPPTPTPTATPTLSATPTPTPPLPTPNTSDSTPPIINITTPANNSVLPTNGTVKINTNASDASGIYQIRIYIDSTLLKTCTAVTACSVNYNPRNVSTGSHIIKAIATDNSANRNASTTQITVTK